VPDQRAGTTRFAVRGNARLAYERVVSPAVAEAPVVVLLHALLAERNALGPVRDALADSYRLVLPDARGHGASASLVNQRLTVAEMAADIAAVLDAEGIGRANLVGRGMGGAAAFELARRDPDRVRSLILIEPSLPAVLDNDPDPAVRDARAKGRQRDRDAGDAAYKGLTDRALDLVLDERWGAGWRARLPRPRLAAVRRHAGALAGSLAALDSYAVNKSDAARLTLPVLVIHDPDAAVIAHQTSERLAAWLPSARLASVPGVTDRGLPLAADAVVALTDVVRAFLAMVTDQKEDQAGAAGNHS
jgi:pimeloyl-ACP methyl ester carboxylesterase